MISNSKLRLIGACGVDGNVPARIATANLAGLLRLFRAVDVPVFQSTIDDPVHEYPHSVHGINGLGGIRIVRPRLRHGQALMDYLKTRKRFQILSLGPLTAIADLLKKSPTMADRISRCVIMGGGFAHGNETPYAEFNIHSSPEAADEVFRSNIPKVLVPLDVTEKVKLDAEDLAALKRSNMRPAVRSVVTGMLEFYFNFEKQKNGFFGGYMHDPSAVVVMTNPELFDFRRAEVRADTTSGKTRGQTVAKFSGGRRANTWIALGANAQRAESIIMDGLTQTSRLPLAKGSYES